MKTIFRLDTHSLQRGSGTSELVVRGAENAKIINSQMCHGHRHPRHCPLVIIPRYIRIHEIGLWTPSTTIVGRD